MTTIPSFIKKNRKKCGLTQVELSEKAGVGLEFIRKVEQGSSKLNIQTLNNLLAFFGYEVSVRPIDREKWIEG